MPFVRMNGQMLKRRLTEGFDGDQCAILRHRLFEQLHNLSAPLCAQNEPNARKRQFVGGALRQTARDDNLRQRVLAMTSANDLHALFIARSRDRTGVDDIDVRLFVKLGRAIARLFKSFAHRLRIILIHLAPKGMKGDCFLF